MFNNPRARVILNEFSTDYFDCPIGVKQGDCISATLFAIFINDLAQEIKDCKIGIDLSELIDGDEVTNIPSSLLFVNILLYADDIVCMADNEADMQELLFIVENWCRKWRLEVNLTKTNIMHVRPNRKPQSNFTFLFNWRPIEYCKEYKYLGITLNEFIDYKITTEILSDAAGRALGSIFSKTIKHGGLPYVTYSTLMESCVNSIAYYASEVWGFKSYDASLKLHLRAARFFLGLPKNAPIPAILADIDWLYPVYNTQIKMIRQFHRILKMENTRLTKMILLWDVKFTEKYPQFSTWSSEIKEVFQNCELGYLFENLTLFPLKETIGSLKSKMKLIQTNDLKIKCANKPQLKKYIEFKDFEGKPSFLVKPLTFIQRKFLCKLSVSCLELRVCTGRYTNTPEAARVCSVTEECGAGLHVESESHFLLYCVGYRQIRQQWLSNVNVPDNFNQLTDAEKIKVLINIDNVKSTAQFIVEAFNLRNRLLFLKS